jgi:hypothetical protein
MQRAATDGQMFLEVLRRMTSPEALQAYRDPGAAPGAMGADGLAALFGSPEIAASVARQASAFAGVAEETMRTLMPSLAAVLMGGLAEQTRAANPLFDQMLKAFEPARQRAPGKGPLDRYEEEQERRERAAAGELAKAQAEMLQSGMAAFEAGAEAWRKALGAATPAGAAPGAETSQADAAKMFEPGLKVAEQYRRQLEALLSSRKRS